MISICMIVKDEEENLRECLESLQSLSYEIVVVDTGSVDNSKNIALQYTDKVYDYEWNNNFSDARNFSITKASNDMIFVVDADEEIIDINKDSLEKMVIENPESVGRIYRKNEYTRKGESYVFNEYVNRIFDRRYFKYEGAIHEQILSKSSLEYYTYDTTVFVKHGGYTNDEILRKNKIDRNIGMLKKALENKDDPYLYYQLGKSYYMNSDYAGAAICFEQALDCNVDTKYEYVEDLIETYGYSLINLNRYKDALNILNLYDEYKWSADFLFLCGLIYMNNGLFKDAIVMLKKASECSSCSMQGVNDYLAYYNIAVIYECLGKCFEALKYYSMCGGYKKAEDRIKIVKKSVVY